MALYYSDEHLLDVSPDIHVCRHAGTRKITHVFHDIDGTHSLIRDWQPVMSTLLDHVIKRGLPDDFDNDASLSLLGRLCDEPSSQEADRFCVESAGLSALTQMEWAIRRAVDAGSIKPDKFGLDDNALELNRLAIARIWKGEELLNDIQEAESFKDYLCSRTPRLFQLYERLLNRVSRDCNLEHARRCPESWRVKGSYKFLNLLRDAGAINYFVTGAVVSDASDGDPLRGMAEEVDALGFNVGPDRLVEALHGSSWSVKRPKQEVMRSLCSRLSLDPTEVLVVGDGRSEIAAGVAMKAVTISRLPAHAERQRALHTELGVNMIVADYDSVSFLKCFQSKG